MPSLVGSEMCIRDRKRPGQSAGRCWKGFCLILIVEEIMVPGDLIQVNRLYCLRFQGAECVIPSGVVFIQILSTIFWNTCWGAWADSSGILASAVLGNPPVVNFW